MVAWMLYAAAAGALVAAAAAGAERMLRLYRRPTRWVWTVALALTLGFTAASAVGSAPASAAPAFDAAPLAMLPSLESTASSPVLAAAGRASVARVLPVVWAGASLALLGWLGWGCAVLAMRRRRWRSAVVERTPVLVSADTGPAVVGFVDPDIVLPEWMLSADARALGMVVRHEREHVAAGDPRLLLAGFAAAVLTPWNPAVWWQLSRLRLAVEVDCDARVLAGRADVDSYGNLLLEVGRRSGASALPAPAFSEPRSSLERRIRAMTARIPRDRLRRALLLAPLCAAAAGAAIALPLPKPVILRAQQEPPRVVRPARAQPPAVVRGTPPALVMAIPAARGDTTSPRLVNAAAVVRELDRRYPAALKQAGVEGQVEVRMVVTAQGAVETAEVVRASRPEFGAAAVEVMRTARFEPARADGRAVPTVVHVPLRFTLSPAEAPAGEPPHLPRPAQWDQGPALANPDEIARALARHYPAELRAAGVEGRADVRIHIRADGSVAAVEVVSATREEFGPAAAAAVRTARFRPARKGSAALAVEVEMPVVFTLDAGAPR